MGAPTARWMERRRIWVWGWGSRWWSRSASKRKIWKETMERQASPSQAPLRAPLTSLPMWAVMFPQVPTHLSLCPCIDLVISFQGDNPFHISRLHHAGPFSYVHQWVLSLLQECQLHMTQTSFKSTPLLKMFMFPKFIRSALFNSSRTNFFGSVALHCMCTRLHTHFDRNSINLTNLNNFFWSWAISQDEEGILDQCTFCETDFTSFWIHWPLNQLRCDQCKTCQCQLLRITLSVITYLSWVCLLDVKRALAYYS